jgi:hypothetical protein
VKCHAVPRSSQTRNLRILAHKLRSFLTLLGVIFGVATVIVVVSLIEGFNVYVDEKIADIGTNAFAVRKYSIDDFASIEALSAARRRNKNITLEDVAALRGRGGAIHEVGAKAQGIGNVIHGSTTLFRMFINATTANIVAKARHRGAVSHRSGNTDRVGWFAWHCRWQWSGVADPDVDADLHSAVGADRRVRRVSGIGCCVWIVAGVEGRTTQSNRRITLRMKFPQRR